MKTSNIIFLIAVVLTAAGCNKRTSNTEKKDISVTIDTQKTKQPISPYLYGMFLEHLGNADVGNLFDDCLWAELLDDRKFFYPVDLIDKQTPVNNKDTMNQWRPLHRAESVRMDSIHPYVGVHSPLVKTTRTSTEGIVQSGIEVTAGKKYNGRIVLSGDAGVQVSVSLVWGNEPAQRATYPVAKLTASYAKYNFSFDCPVAAKNARLEIEGKGDGKFAIGAVSLMPADNVEGFRPDVIALLKGLNSGLYRWGGNMSSAYDWRDGIGDPDKRPTRYEYAWNTIETNDVGAHELLAFAKLIGVEISLSVNAGFGDAYSAAQWVEYMNSSKETPMGKWRAQNGHPDPFGVKLWCVGNEMYGWWQLGHTDLANYTIKYRLFSERMRLADPTIKLIASGATIDEMTITETAFRITGKVQAEYDSPADWTGGLLRNDQKEIDFMSEHFYCSVDQRFDLATGKYVNVNEPLEEWTRRPANRVRAKAEHYKAYHERIPGSDKIPVYIDEWAYFTNWVHPTPTLGVTIGYARSLHEMFRHTDLIKMAGFTFGTSCLSFNYTGVTYNSTGLLFKLYQSTLGSIPVGIVGNSPQPSPAYPVGGDQPSVNAGGDASPLDIVAALTSDRKALTVAIINPTEEDQSITIALNALKTTNKIKLWRLHGTSPMARNIVGKEPQVTVDESEIDLSEKLALPPASVTIFKYEIVQ